jgi:hypothetical protein
LRNFFDSKEELPGNVRMKTSDSILIRDEYLNSMRLIRIGTGLKNLIQFRGTLTSDDEKPTLTRSWNRFLERVGTAGAAIYLKLS